MKSNMGKSAVDRIACALENFLVDFDKQQFIKKALDGLDNLELKQRVGHIINVLHQFLPDDFEQTVPVLSQVKDNWDYGDPNDTGRSFAAWPIVDYVGIYGLDYPEISLSLLKGLTCLFSAEFAIRPFIVKYPDYCHQQFLLWVNAKNEEVRRLVSEGTRPRLPWGMQLKEFIHDPKINLPLLDQLKDDESLYVRRSVANHLNDIAKDNPEVVIATCKNWKISSGNDHNVDWVIKHATRTLIKSGHPSAFSLLGYTENPLVDIFNFSLSKKHLLMGDAINFTFQLKSGSTKTQSLVIDYAIHFFKANGKQRSKVFKLKNIILKGNEIISLFKNHSFKPISTRKYYSGEHKIEILINGKSTEIKIFTLKLSTKK